MKNYLKKMNKISVGIAFIMVFLIFIILVFGSKINIFNSLINKVEHMGSTEEVSLDNWELSTVFYDSTVDNGNTPLTEINWDASDGGYGKGETRVITVQINYKNTNAVTTYQPGELRISIPNLLYSNSALLFSSITVGANDSTHVGYDWNFQSKTTAATYIFTNEVTIEEKTNLEGSIQIIYSITPGTESPEKYIDECVHTHNKSLSSVLSHSRNSNKELSVISNEVLFNYNRKYIHPWKRRNYSIYKSANKLSSYDGLPSDAEDYYWVKYEFRLYGNLSDSYPYVGASYYIEDFLPEDCVVLNNKFEKLTLEGGYYKDSDFSDVSASYNPRYEYLYVGYPKSVYNESVGNLSITNSVDLYIKYGNSENYELMDTDEVSLNLSNVDLKYPANLYSIYKSGNSSQQLSVYSYSSSDIIYQSIIDDDGNNKVRWTVSPKVYYTGTPLTVEVGDDLVYLTNKNGDYERATDNDYYYEKIYIPCIYNNNRVKIQKDKYNMRLYVRYANTDEFVQYGKDFKNHDMSSSKKITFSENEIVVAWYLQIDDMNEGISSFYVESDMRIMKKDINESGTLFNFAYLQVFSKDDNGNLNLLNQQEEADYTNFIKNEQISSYDLQKHNSYIQRIVSSKKWSYYKILDLTKSQSLYKTAQKVSQDVENERFYGSFQLEKHFDGKRDATVTRKQLLEQVTEDDYQTNFVVYDLLPRGISLLSTSEEIKESVSTNMTAVYNINKEPAFSNINANDFFKEHTEVQIIQNWKNTGRTKIEIIVNFSDYPLYFVGRSMCRTTCAVSSYTNKINYSYNYEITYDSLLEYGTNYTNYAYSVSTDDVSYNSKVLDNGVYDKDAIDINENGDVSDVLSYAKDSVAITSAISTHQDTTTYVQTDKNNYSTGVVDVSYGSNYEYKMRVRTGSADVTNLILYTNIEEGHNGRGHWKGEFLGIDTTYAEGKGYTIKTYYSEKSNATNMKDDSSWQEYTDKTDKAKVKSLAFVLLDSEGNVAVLPKNSLVYILLKMKAPSDENIKTLAYNNSWTEWNAIDSVTKEPVDFITGINSNTVKVSLPNSVQYEDIEINLEKIWKDNNNEFGLRPKEIAYKVISNGDIDDAIDVILNTGDVNLTNSNKWSKIIEVPKYDDEGEEIIYTISEVAPTLPNNYTYIKTIDNLSITNELAKSITITKKWMDNKNSYLTRPSNVTIKVLQNGKNYKDITITGDYSINEWVKTIDVPVYDEKGKEYVYTLEEVSVDNYESSYDSATYTFTNTLFGEEEIVITKKWIDNHNKFNTRPKEILVKLKQNGRDYQSLTMNGDSDTWLSEKIIVPKYDSNGTKYIYTIEEDPLNSYGFVEYDQTNYVITNTLKENIGIVVTKNWVDDNNSYDTRPGSLNITLLQNNKEYKILTLSGNGNTWTNDIEVPKYDDNQEEYKYTIKELNENIITEYSDVTYGEDGLSVTNKLKKNVDLIITKKWIDYDNEYLTRPDKVTINLFQNDVLYEKLELTGKDNTWSNKVLNVPAYDENGIKYHYTIEEVNDGETSKYQKITYDQTTLTVTNELTERPKVTLYFTVKNGYAIDDDEIKFDEEGLKELLKAHNLNVDGEYLYEFKLENISTGDVYKGHLSTQGILEFSDLPYGTYRAVEGEDEYFDFVSMLNIEDIPGVTFKKDEIGGIIEIVPTGTDIIYGVNVVNKIKVPVDNPPTTSLNIFCLLGIIIAAFISCCYFIKTKKEF